MELALLRVTPSHLDVATGKWGDKRPGWPVCCIITGSVVGRLREPLS